MKNHSDVVTTLRSLKHRASPTVRIFIAESPLKVKTRLAGTGGAMDDPERSLQPADRCQSAKRKGLFCLILEEDLLQQFTQKLVQFTGQFATGIHIRQILKGALPPAYRETQPHIRELFTEFIPPFLDIPPGLLRQTLLSKIGQRDAERLPGADQTGRRAFPEYLVGDARRMAGFFVVLNAVPFGVRHFQPQGQR